QLGRLVGAVPGPVTSVSSAGTHRLLRQGVASLVTDAADISALFGSADENSQTFSREPSVSHPMRSPPPPPKPLAPPLRPVGPSVLGSREGFRTWKSRIPGTPSSFRMRCRQTALPWLSPSLPGHLRRP